MAFIPKNTNDFNLRLRREQGFEDEQIFIKGGNTVVEDTWFFYKDRKIDIKSLVNDYVSKTSRRLFNHVNDVFYILLVMSKNGTIEVIPSLAYNKKSFGDVKVFPELSGKVPLALVKLRQDGSSDLTGISTVTKKDIQIYDGYGNFTLKGDRGATGYAGPTGYMGITGLSGCTGLIGLTGIQGYTGIEGSQVQGSTGLSGEQGDSIKSYVKDDAIAEFSADFTCRYLGDSVIFTDTSGGDIIERHWDFGDGNTSIEKNPKHTYLSYGQYTVTLSVFDANGEYDVKTKTNYVGINPTINVNFCGYPLTGYFGDTHIFWSEATGSLTGWYWDFGDGTPGATGPIAVHSFTGIPELAGEFDIKLTVKDICGNTGALIKEKLVNQLYAPLIVDFEGIPNAGGAPLTVSFIDHSTGVGLTGYEWTFEGSGTPGATGPNVMAGYTGVGSYDVKLKVWDQYGGVQWATKKDYIAVL